MKLIQKSVRIPEDLVEFVENREGDSFSGKLVDLLLELKYGKLGQKIAYQEQCMERNRLILEDQSRKINDASHLLFLLAGVLSCGEEMLDELGNGSVRGS